MEGAGGGGWRREVFKGFLPPVSSSLKGLTIRHNGIMIFFSLCLSFLLPRHRPYEGGKRLCSAMPQLRDLLKPGASNTSMQECVNVLSQRSPLEEPHTNTGTRHGTTLC